MADFYKHFLGSIFEKLEQRSMGTPFDIDALGEKIRLAKSANIDAMAFFQKCHEDGLTIEEAFAAFDAEIAKIPPQP